MTVSTELVTKAVALVGFSKLSNQGAYSLPDGMELWTCNHGHVLNFPRIDALFEMHQWELIQDPNYLTEERRNQHTAFMKAPHDFPIYMAAILPTIPASVRFPLEDAQGIAGKYLGFTSSFCYMIALAIMDGFDRIEVHGFDMDTVTEYRYQREDALRWISFAEGRGIDVHIAPTSGLLEEKILYGYEGIPMVSRQTLEAHKKQYDREQQSSYEKMTEWIGVLKERRKLGASRRKITEAGETMNGYMRQAAMNEGASQALQFLLDTCDLKEVEPILVDKALVEKQ